VTLLCQVSPETLLRIFSQDPHVIESGTEYLRIIALSFVASGLVFTCSGMFQALGNTWPSLASSVARLIIFAIPAVLLSRRPGFHLYQLWYLSVTTGVAHAAVAYLLLRREMNRKLTDMEAPSAVEHVVQPRAE
jgi:Na+-driven multidrug efflux pump